MHYHHKHSTHGTDLTDVGLEPLHAHNWEHVEAREKVSVSVLAVVAAGLLPDAVMCRPVAGPLAAHLPALLCDAACPSIQYLLRHRFWQHWVEQTLALQPFINAREQLYYKGSNSVADLQHFTTRLEQLAAVVSIPTGCDCNATPVVTLILATL